VFLLLLYSFWAASATATLTDGGTNTVTLGMTRKTMVSTNRPMLIQDVNHGDRMIHKLLRVAKLYDKLHGNYMSKKSSFDSSFSAFNKQLPKLNC